MPLGGVMMLGAFWALYAACFWPVAGTATFGTFFLVRGHIAAAQPPCNPVAIVALLFTTVGLALYLGI